MKKIKDVSRKTKVIFWKVGLLAIVVNAFFLPSYTKVVKDGNNIFTVFLDGTPVGVVDNEKCVDEYLSQARLEIARESDNMTLVDADIQVEGREVFFGLINSPEDMVRTMKPILKENIKKTRQRSFTVKINEFTVNLATSDEVIQLLQATIDKYDTENQYIVDLVTDTSRELNVLTTGIKSVEEEQKEQIEDVEREAGVAALFSEIFESATPIKEKDFSDYDLGLLNIAFGDTVEVVEAYLFENELTSLEDAIELVTKDQEKNKIYEVLPGDTLSGIAYRNELDIEKLVAMNANIENENSMIRAGDEIIVTVPEPELSVERVEEQYYEEDYEAEVVYVPNDSWYNSEQVTIQEPSAGHRRVIVDVSYRNDAEIGRTIIKEEVVMEAVPKIIERGTKIPPTYIKPLSGGRISSYFGRRKAPTKGASTYHKAVDWAVPTGTAIVSSATGTVTKAGWGSGYGYVVYIRHTDGRETRYAHLSKVLVKAGQTVSQGQKIALSGNTGRSTGPHLHFEMLLNGGNVDPLKYLN